LNHGFVHYHTLQCNAVNLESETQGQTVLKANAGINLDEFYRFCTFHALRISHELLLSTAPSSFSSSSAATQAAVAPAWVRPTFAAASEMRKD
jgi:hypothetical protein